MADSYSDGGTKKIGEGISEAQEERLEHLHWGLSIKNWQLVDCKGKAALMALASSISKEDIRILLSNLFHPLGKRKGWFVLVGTIKIKADAEFKACILDHACKGEVRRPAIIRHGFGLGDAPPYGKLNALGTQELEGS